MVTPRVGTQDPLLAFTPTWITLLAQRVDRLWVVTPRAEPIPLPGNVEVHEVGRDYGRGETLFHALRNFHHTMRHLTHDEPVDGIFTHMYPRFAILASPYARLRRLPIVMWYTHTHISWQLRLAEKLVDCIITASRGSCRLDSSKINVIGHGIDTRRFLPAPSARRPGQPFTILSVGRISPAKHYEVILQAVALLVHQEQLVHTHLQLVGDTPNAEHSAYLARLKSQIAAHDLSKYVSFEGVIPYRQIVPVYQQADVFVSASRTGLDKAVLEAMACGAIPIVSLEEFKPTLREYADLLMYEPGNPVALSKRLRHISLMPPDRREWLRSKMHELVEEQHEASALMDKLVSIFRELLRR